LNKSVPIAGGSDADLRVPRVHDGRIARYRIIKGAGRPGVEPLTALPIRGTRGVCGQWVQLLPHPAGAPPESGQGCLVARPLRVISPYQTPELLGSERTGPDLTNIGVRQPSSVWQYIHLYNPRAVVPESIMPSFNCSSMWSIKRRLA